MNESAAADELTLRKTIIVLLTVAKDKEGNDKMRKLNH